MQSTTQMLDEISKFCELVLDGEEYDSKKHMEMYSICVAFCQQSVGAPLQLYNLLHEKCVLKLKTYFKKSQAIQNGNDLLIFFLTCKNQYYISCRRLSHVFTYIDRFFVKQQKALGTKNQFNIFPSCMSLFWTDFFKGVAQKATTSAMDLLKFERKESSPEYRSIIGDVMRMFLIFSDPEMVIPDVVNEDIYSSIYQVNYIQTSNVHFKYLCEEISGYPISSFLEKTIEIIRQEKERSQYYVSPNEQKDFWEVLQKNFIKQQCTFIKDKFSDLLKGRFHEDLKKAVDVLRFGEELQTVIPVFEDYCTVCGNEKISDWNSNSPSGDLVETVLKFYQDIQDLIHNSLDSQTVFKSAFSGVFRILINRDNERRLNSVFPEYLAKYSDTALKRCTTPEEVDSVLSKIFEVYDYIENKDVFENYYVRTIAKRMLLKGNSTDVSQESLVFEKNKLKFSTSFSFKIQKMISDLHISQDLSSRFSDVTTIDFPFFINVLQTSVWPLEPPHYLFQLPTQLNELHNLFGLWYGRQHQKRKLQWLHQYSRGKVKANHLPRLYNFFGSAYQLSVLVLFNTKDEYTVDEIFAAIQSTMDIVKSVVASLVNIGLLEVNDNKYLLSNRFKAHKSKVVLPIPKPIQIQQETKEEEKEINAQRVGLIEANIVRFMKRNRRMVHNELIQAVVTSLSSRFRPPLPLVKKTIESLIEREYMARSDVRKDEYVYVE
ncbi:Cullin-2 [Entamoeba marina]